MYVNQIQRFVEFCTRPPHEGKPQLSVRAWLSCPLCRGIHEVVSNPRVVLESLRPHEPKYTVGAYQNEVLAVLRQHRNCQRCGTLSALPARDMEGLSKALQKAITVEWLDLQIAALGHYVSFSTQVTDAVLLEPPITDKQWDNIINTWREEGEGQ